MDLLGRSGSDLSSSTSGGKKKMGQSTSRLSRGLSQQRMGRSLSNYEKQETLRAVHTDKSLNEKNLRMLMARGTSRVQEEEDFTPGEEIMVGATSGTEMANLIYMAEASVNHDVKKIGIYRSILAKIIVEDEWQRKTCMSLPSTLLFIFLFTVCFLNYFDVPMIYQQEATLRNGFTEDLYEFTTADEVYDWLEESYFPYLWTMPRTFDLAEDALRPASTSGTTNFELLAGVILHTGRSKGTKCQEVKGWSDQLCDPEIGETFREADPVFVGWSDNQESTMMGGRRLHNSAMMVRKLFGLGADDEDERLPVENETDLDDTGIGKEKTVEQGEEIQNEAVQDVTDTPSPDEIKESISKEEETKQKREARWKDYNEAYEQYVREQRDMLHKRSDREYRQRREKRSRQWKHAGGVAKTRRLVEGARTEIRGKKRGASVLKPWTWGRLLPPQLFRSASKKDKPSASRIIGQEGAANSEAHVSSRRGSGENKQAPRDNSLRQKENRRLKQALDELALMSAYPAAYPSGSSYGKVITVSWELERIKQEIQMWREQKLLDRSTLFFSTTSIIMNRPANLITVTNVRFSFSRGGTIFGGLTMTSVNIDFGSMVVGGLALWLIGVLVLLGSLVRQAISAYKASKFTSYISRVSTMFDWAIALAAFCIIAFFFGVRFNIDRLKQRSSLYNEERANVAANKLEAFDNSWFRSLYSSTQLAVFGDNFLQIFVAYYLIVLILKYLLSSRGQPRLAIVVNTVAKAGIDLLHLAIVLVIVLLCFVASGHLLFGRRMVEFSTLIGSFAYTIKIVFQREYDWHALSFQDIYTSLFWVICLLIFVVLILFNLILAMIFDTYSELRQASADSATVFGTVSHLMTQLTLYSTWQPSHTVLSALLQGMGKKSSKKQEQLTAEGLKNILPEIGDTQINHIFNAAKKRMSMMITRGNKNILPESLATILLRINDVHTALKLLNPHKDPKVVTKVLYCDHDPTIGGGAEDKHHSHHKANQKLHHTGAPMATPLWIENGLVPLLEKRQRTMQTLLLKLKKFEDFATERGAVTEGDLSCPLPDVPSPFESMLEPANRDGLLINMPRATHPHWAVSNGSVDPSRKSIEYEDGARYLGELNSAGLREGFGRHVWEDGTMYEGQWLNDKAHGHGTFTQGDKYTYQGQWMENLMHGAGEETFADGTRRQGFWNQGTTTQVAPGTDNAGHTLSARMAVQKPTGKFTQRKGNSYQVVYEDSDYFGPLNESKEREGEGTQIWKDGAKYVGQWSADKVQGEGEFFLPDGSSFKGQWVDNAPHGDGQHTNSDGTTVRGTYHRGMRSREADGVSLQKKLGRPATRPQEVPSEQNYRIEYDDGAFYKGDVNNEEHRHGKGKQEWPDGGVYEGSWVEDSAEGFGVYTLPDGFIYTGQWAANAPNGEGEERLTDGSTYSGFFLNGVRHGVGMMQYAEGSMYNGGWEKGRPNGKGLKMEKNGDTYDGGWKDGMKHGKGVRTWKTGEEYEGDSHEDKKHGVGVMKWPDGSCYAGAWKMDKRQGYGIMIFADGLTYKGQWLDDLMHGTGKLVNEGEEEKKGTWIQGEFQEPGIVWKEDKGADGSKYSGYYLHGQRHGAGEMQYADGSVYNGNWEKGKPNGKGVKTEKHGETYDGEWQNGMKHGKGVSTWSGEEYEGDWQEDRRHGVGVMKWPDESCYAGAWKMGVRQGYGMMIFADGLTYKGQWLDDQMHGTGKLITEGEEVEKKGTWSYGEFQEPA